MLQEIWATIVAEFSDVPDLETATKITVRILIAAALGGVLGYERERKSIGAGMRTHMLVAVGAAIFMKPNIVIRLRERSLKYNRF